MKYALHKTTLICLLMCPCYAMAADYIADERPSTNAANPVESVISYQTEFLPKWSFDLKFDRQLPDQSIWLDTIDQRSPIESVRISASRLISSNSSQRLFAAVQSSNHSDVDDTFLLLPTNAGNAASFGWQLGEPESLSMALEFEYREVGEVDINTLMMGVQYAF
ncbi:hypothetical protein OPS25_13285 [Alteromonas ponticola]|uniref:Outer membrane protein beta-barrel domain-containing protein n=1 Tax=Alteromonas aquimaris TaxID=2998417 RepID=A0ABT3P9M7_9ALTE|nr:hypothetical protein [Alteromonas aquimaris]MCW8109477.1 hypothetical protein [Alteromonas aquimaris]